MFVEPNSRGWRKAGERWRDRKPVCLAGQRCAQEIRYNYGRNADLALLS
jgi:hypothetical protein